MTDVAIALAINKLKELEMNISASAMLNEKRYKLLSLRCMLQALQECLHDSDLKYREISEAHVGRWIMEVRSVAVEIEDLVNEFIWKIDSDELKSAWWKCLCLDPIKDVFLVREISKQIDEINSRLKNVCFVYLSSIRKISYGPGSLNNLTHSSNFYLWGMSQPKLVDYMFGFDKYIKTMNEKLLCGSDRRAVVCIEGESGIGKTTLAKKVYNSTEIQNHFDVTIWLHLPLHVRFADLHAQILENLLMDGQEIEEEPSDFYIRGCIYNCLQGKRYIVVLDDISSMSDWEGIRLILPEEEKGSRVVVISRPGSEVGGRIRSEAEIISLDYLSKDDSRGLFCQRAFSSFDWPREFTDISFEDIYDISGGHPLFVLVLAGLLCSQVPPVTWMEILARLKLRKRLESAIRKALSLSFDYLPNDVKLCFLYFAGLPKRTVFSVDKLVRLWDAEGFLESGHGRTAEKIGEDILEELISRRLVQLVSKDGQGCLKEVELHDLIHDFVRSEARYNEFFEICEGISWPPMHRLSLGNYVYKNPLLFTKLRSLLYYFDERPRRAEVDLDLNFLRWSRFLRVIDIRSSLVRKVPEEIGTMIHLRYLGICSKELKELPSSVKNLIHLQTLDISGTSVTNLASGFWNIPTLKHVFGSLLVVPPRVGYLVNLLTLRSVNCSNWNPASYSVLHNMGNIKSLELRGLLHYDANVLLSALGKLEFLKHLILAGKNLPLRVFAIPTFFLLESLELHGTLDNNWGFDTVSNMDDNLRFLKTVRLFSSNATQALVNALSLLPNLLNLEMNKAYDGHELVFCADGFDCLKELELVELDELHTCRIEAFCMPQLEKLTLVKCANLRMPFDGLSNLTQLKELTIYNMPRLVQSIYEGGDDYHTGISHVQVIKTRR